MESSGSRNFRGKINLEWISPSVMRSYLSNHGERKQQIGTFAIQMLAHFTEKANFQGQRRDFSSYHCILHLLMVANTLTCIYTCNIWRQSSFFFRSKAQLLGACAFGHNFSFPAAHLIFQQVVSVLLSVA